MAIFIHSLLMKDLQVKIKEFCKKHNLDASPEHRVLDTLSELGEVAKEVLKTTAYGRKPAIFREEIKSELGDLLYSVITIANAYEVDLDEALKIALGKYEKRLRKGAQVRRMNKMSRRTSFLRDLTLERFDQLKART